MAPTTFVGLDVHKRTTSVAIADRGRSGEVRFLGEIPSTPEALHRLVERLKARHRRLSFCYEAGPCGYGVHRLLSSLGQECSVVAPSLIPTRPGDRVKTNRRDATALAKLHRAGELAPVWVPDAAHEAMRDLVRARATARRVLGKARQHLQGFLLRHGRIYRGVRGWTRAYRPETAPRFASFGTVGAAINSSISVAAPGPRHQPAVKSKLCDRGKTCQGKALWIC
jgi:transposase